VQSGKWNALRAWVLHGDASVGLRRGFADQSWRDPACVVQTSGNGGDIEISPRREGCAGCEGSEDHRLWLQQGPDI